MVIRYCSLMRAAGLAVSSASVLLSIGNAAQAHSPKGAPARAVTRCPPCRDTASARSIVTNLWSRREVALATLSAARLAPIERASARRTDTAYVANVLCKCEPQKDRHPASAVVAQVPKRTVKPVFFAQVRTTNGKQEHPWYLVAVERDRGAWKLALIAFGGYGTAPAAEAHEVDPQHRR